MQIMRLPLLLSAAALLLVSACAAKPKIEDNGQYWQRVSASSATYLRGPKAQQMLNRDISRCVVELRELERLGSIKAAIPADKRTGRVLDPDSPQRHLDEWDTPERDGHLLSEHGNYHDFDSCMVDKGWERIKYVPYEVAQQSRKTYVTNHVHYRDQYNAAGHKKNLDPADSGDDFSDLNE